MDAEQADPSQQLPSWNHADDRRKRAEVAGGIRDEFELESEPDDKLRCRLVVVLATDARYRSRICCSQNKYRTPVLAYKHERFWKRRNVVIIVVRGTTAKLWLRRSRK